MALGSCGHRITHQLRPINMNGRSILSETSWFGYEEPRVKQRVEPVASPFSLFLVPECGPPAWAGLRPRRDRPPRFDRPRNATQVTDGRFGPENEPAPPSASSGGSESGLFEELVMAQVPQAVVWLVSAVLVEAAVIDGRQLRVPNWLTFHFALGGLVFTAWYGGREVLLWSLLVAGGDGRRPDLAPAALCDRRHGSG